MSYNTPKNNREDVILGACIAGRDITIPLTARYLPVLRFASADIVIAIEQDAIGMKPIYCDGSVEIGVGVNGPIVPELNTAKSGAVDMNIGVNVEPKFSHSCVVDVDMAIGSNINAVGTHGHIGGAEIAHDIIPDASFSKMIWGEEMLIGIGTGFEIKAVSQESPDDLLFGTGIGIDVEATTYRGRNLNDLGEATLSDISDMTLQELYWIESQ